MCNPNVKLHIERPTPPSTGNLTARGPPAAMGHAAERRFDIYGHTHKSKTVRNSNKQFGGADGTSAGGGKGAVSRWRPDPHFGGAAAAFDRATLALTPRGACTSRVGRRARSPCLNGTSASRSRCRRSQRTAYS
eukprot:2545440-Prymnesium_polylepis.1